jgi:hypothetical protein
MEKALVEIFLPAAGTRYDVYIPLACRMSEVLLLTAKVVGDLSEGKYKATGDAVLCDAETGSIFDVNLSAAELGIRNGSRLLLI